MAIDPTQDQQSVLVSNFLVMLGVALIFATDMHHLAIGALDESYNLFKPGAALPTGDIAELMITTVSGAFRVGIQLAAPFLVFGILFNVGLGVLARLMPQLQVFFLGLPASILIGFAILLALVGVLMGTFISYLGGVFEQIGSAELTADHGRRIRTTIRNAQKTRRQNGWKTQSSAATSPRARRSIPGSCSRAGRSRCSRSAASRPSTSRARSRNCLRPRTPSVMDGRAIIRLSGSVLLDAMIAVGPLAASRDHRRDRRKPGAAPMAVDGRVAAGRKLSRISPAAGAKRLFSKHALVQFAKGLAKIGIVSAVIVAVMMPRDRHDHAADLFRLHDDPAGREHARSRAS